MSRHDSCLRKGHCRSHCNHFIKIQNLDKTDGNELPSKDKNLRLVSFRCRVKKLRYSVRRGVINEIKYYK